MGFSVENPECFEVGRSGIVDFSGTPRFVFRLQDRALLVVRNENATNHKLESIIL